MRTHQIQVFDAIHAPAARVYGIIADYRNGHPQIVPRPPFGDIVVEQGGVGAGTVIHFTMRAFGRTRIFRTAITEPVPGHVLVESDLDGGPTTTFLVDGDESGCIVTIVTEMKTRGWPLGMIERWLATRFLRGVYERELRLLEKVASAPLVPAP